MSGEERNGRERLELERIRAETRKLNTEAAKIERERNLYPIVLVTAALVAMGTLVGAALRFIL